MTTRQKTEKSVAPLRKSTTRRRKKYIVLGDSTTNEVKINSITEGFRRTLGVSVKNRTGMIRRIRDGLSVKSFDHLAKEMRLNTNLLATITEIPLSTLNRRKKRGSLKPDESDRLVRLASVFNLAVELFEGDSERAAKWFRTPKKALENVSPLDYVDTEIGTQEVVELIGRLEHGVFS